MAVAPANCCLSEKFVDIDTPAIYPSKNDNPFH